VANERFMIEAGGMEREYLLTVPDFDPETPHPLVIAIHGADGRDYPFNQQSRWEGLARDEGMILAYPLSELVRPNEGEWQLNTREDMMHDIDFMNALIDEISNRYCVDAGRVYATGYSLGSMFNYELACHMNDRFAAIASVAGTMPVDPNACDIIDPVPILHVHGRRDSIISYTDEWDWKEWDPVGTMRDIPGLIDYWGERYGCSSESSTELDDSLYVVMDDCDNPDVRVEHHMVREGNHEWPLQINGTSTHLVLWDFMRQFSKP
jgi:polyhydroxybutyrate depolymerase